MGQSDSRNDVLTEQITAFAASLSPRRVPREAAHHVKRFAIDSLGCGIAALGADTVRTAREQALSVPVGEGGATILGTDRRTSGDLAAFANGTAVRYLDFNDTYLGRDVCHPSDHIAPVLAAAEAAGTDGRRAILGILVAYEVHGALCDARNVRARGWDQGTYGGIASAAAAATAMGLGAREMREAIRISTASNLSLAGTRFGTVSMWKAAATSFATRNSVLAAMLARRGMTGPARIFEGRGGFFEAVSGPLEIRLPKDLDDGLRVAQSRIKAFPSGYHSQAAIEAALAVRPRVGPVQEIREIALETYDDAVEFMAGDPEKWAPATRETADHSLPYVIAVALVHGDVALEHFEDRRLADPLVGQVIRKVTVKATEECNQAAPEGTLAILRVTTADGRAHTERVLHHRGHPRNPMSDAEVEDKFRRLVRGSLSPAQADAALAGLWRLEELNRVGDLMALFRVPALSAPA